MRRRLSPESAAALFWDKSPDVKRPTPQKPKKVLLERRTNYMRFGATKLDKVEAALADDTLISSHAQVEEAESRLFRRDRRG